MHNQKQSFQGQIASTGMAIGRAFIFCYDRIKIPHKKISSRKVGDEIERLDVAVLESQKKMQILLKESQLTDDMAAIFEAQFSLLHDPMFIGETREKIRLCKINAEWAIEGELNILKEFLLRSENSIFQERADDLEDVGNRILKCLLGIEEGKKFDDTFFTDYRGPLIVVVDQLTPSVFLQIPLERVEGIICQAGGLTSHLAILSRSYNLPALFNVQGFLKYISNKDVLFLDCHTGYKGNRGGVIINPDSEEIDFYRGYLIERSHTQARIIFSPIQTGDGTPINIWANLDGVKITEDERLKKLSGVGLFRTEFLYMKDTEILSNPEKHVELYIKILKNLNHKPIQFRLIDVSEDKPLPIQFFNKQKLRGARFLLANHTFLVLQLKSIFMAAIEMDYPDEHCRILCPMVSSLEEIQIIKKVIEEVSSELEAKIFQKLPKISMGIMIETPAAVEMIEVFSKYVSFFCIGSNDLMRLNLDIDRDMSDGGDDIFYHPILYRQIKKILTLSQVPVSLCGSLATEKKLLPLLIGLGMQNLSVPLSAVVNCAKVIENSYYESCLSLSQRILEAESTSELKKIIETL